MIEISLMFDCWNLEVGFEDLLQLQISILYQLILLYSQIYIYISCIYKYIYICIIQPILSYLHIFFS